MYAEAFKTGVLKEEAHSRLVLNLTQYAKDAGIEPYWVWTPLADVCGEDEAEYLRRYYIHKEEHVISGLLYMRSALGDFPDADKHMAALAGGFVRNFIRARMMTLSTVLGLLEDGEDVTATVLLIPNFAMSKDEGGELPSWKSRLIYDLLLQRATKGQHTVLYASTLADVSRTYGTACARLLNSRFRKVLI